MTALHRVEQFFGHVRASVTPAEMANARSLLAEDAWLLFAAMPVADQRHALDVVQRLLAAGIDDRDLQVAALLHDSAKGHRMRLWHRVAAVLLDSVAPSQLRRLASPDARSWRFPFYLYLHHPEMSAAAAAEAGCSARAAGFIRGIADEADASLLAALAIADEAS